MFVCVCVCVSALSFFCKRKMRFINIMYYYYYYYYFRRLDSSLEVCCEGP